MGRRRKGAGRIITLAAVAGGALFAWKNGAAGLIKSHLPAKGAGPVGGGK